MKTDGDRLSITQIRRHLDTEVVGRHIYLLGTVDSTNAVARRLAEHGAEEGTVVLAEAQTAGRGRPGVGYVSVLFRPALAVRDIGRFAPIASLALSEAIEAEQLTAEINWPNDVIEVATVDDRVSYVILGVGVSEVAGREIDRNRFMAHLLNSLEKWHRIVVADGPEALLAATGGPRSRSR